MNNDYKIEVAELTGFKADCLNCDIELVVQKYLVDGMSYFFSLFHNEHEEFMFKKTIAHSLNVHIRDIAIVGSGKLGLSIKPERGTPGLYLFKEFDHDYDVSDKNKKSDLDVAIISGELFDSQLRNIYEYTGGYSSSEYTGDRKKQFGSYILKGWLRPDKIPKDYEITPEIILTQSKLSNKYERDVNIGIYKSWFYFEKYHQNNIHTLMINLLA